MLMEEMLDEEVLVMLWMGISPRRKNSKSSTIRNEGFRRLQGPGRDAFVVGFGGLTLFQGTKPGVLPQNNPIKDGNVGVNGQQHGNVLDHPEIHLVSDHVATFG